jgi:hypothetical protein
MTEEGRGEAMSIEMKKSYGSTLALILFGVLTLLLGTSWLVVTVPAAILVWYGTSPKLQSGRN